MSVMAIFCQQPEGSDLPTKRTVVPNLSPSHHDATTVIATHHTKVFFRECIVAISIEG